MTQEQIEEQGVKLSQRCNWDGTAIFAIAMEALTDANFHTLRCRLEDAYNNYVEETK